MEKITQKDIDWLLNLDDEIKSGPSPSSPKNKSKRYGLRISVALFIIIGLVLLPFFLLIRTSVFLNVYYNLNAWVALTAGVIATVVLLSIYLLLFFRKFPNKKLVFKVGLAASGILVFTYCMYGLLYLSSVNAKSDEIRNVYRSMHPILRVAVATTTLADGELVITDISRNPEDYTSMGLPVNQRSLHFPQPESGYVHAIDLRTIGRSEFRNLLIQFSLEIMGFYTLRHTGTADHLHISIPRSG
ncbi:MAG: hypothetical protein RI564_07285 [Gracilimonas sp.]|jgi:hypothetical protein|nr:hypothetical protein [Gracilimonas sp.]